MLTEKYFSTTLGIQHYSQVSEKYKMFLFREIYFGFNKPDGINLKLNLLTVGVWKFIEPLLTQNSPTNYNNDGIGLFLLFTFLFPNGILFTKEIGNTPLVSGIIIEPFSYDHWHFKNNNEINNYMCEFGFPFYYRISEKDYLSMQLFFAYQYNLSSPAVTPENFSNNNFSFRINIAYIFGIKLKSNEY
ncbi:MAG: hypothetical protein Fur0023_17110 [Bacteroidia bacterium]